MTRHRHDGGSVTPFLLLLMIALAAVLGLEAEGGAVMSARVAAATEAEQAARAGAAVISADTLHAGGIASGGRAAVAAAEYLMAASGHAGTAWATSASVTARVDRYPVATPMLALVGIPSIDVTAEATARAVAG